MSGSYVQRARLGLLQKFAPGRLGALAAPAGKLLPRSVRSLYGIVTEGEIGALLDSSGFAYTDQWGPNASERLARNARRLRSQGKRIVLLPQAFGPFRTDRTRSAFKKVLDHVDLVFARDSISAAHLADLGSYRASVKQSPDFTVAVAGRPSNSFAVEPGMVAVIPNCRMIDKKEGSEAAYRTLLTALIRHTQRRGYRPFLLVHDLGADRTLAEEISAQSASGIEIVIEPDPRALKGVLGSCHAVIASRFHALVGAMVQGVPSLGTGWSHKYDELFREFGCPDAICDGSDAPADAVARLDVLLDGAQRSLVVEQLTRTGELYANKTGQMWDEVATVIGISPGGPQ